MTLPGSGADAVAAADAAANAAAEDAAAVGGSSYFVQAIPCGAISPDAEIITDDDGFVPDHLDLKAGDIVRFTPDREVDMHSVRGVFATPLGETTCLAFGRRGHFVFDSSSAPEMIGVIDVE